MQQYSRRGWTSVVYRMLAKISMFLVAGLVLATGEKVRYDNYHVYRVLPENLEQLEFLNGLNKYYSDIRFWKDPSAVNMAVDIMVSPKMQNTFLEWLQAHFIQWTVMIENVQHLIDNERPAREPKEGFALDDYHTVEEIIDWMDSLVVAYPDKVRKVYGGNSYLGFEFDGLRITLEGTREVTLHGGMHGRDWIAIACMNWFANEILTTNDTDVRDVIDDFVFNIYPTINRDGYNYTWYTDRLWRKNLQPYYNCKGVDLNRNWGFHFGEYDSSDDPCADNYPGPVAYSEYEVGTFSKTLGNTSPDVVYGSFHAYGQMILMPFGVPGEVATNYDEMLGMAERARDSIAARYGTNYTVGTEQDLLYPESGTDIDWMQGVINRKYNFAWLLRDEGQYGFLLPSDQIVPTCQEAFDGLVSMLRDVQSNSTSQAPFH